MELLVVAVIVLGIGYIGWRLVKASDDPMDTVVKVSIPEKVNEVAQVDDVKEADALVVTVVEEVEKPVKAKKAKKAKKIS